MADEFIGKELLGQFRVVEKIGRGGMGAVYLAEQPAMDRTVAIKILHSKMAARRDIVSRFRREARAMSRLTHPNTVRVFLYGQLEETGQLYIVMEYLKGHDLAKITRRDGPMELTRAVKVLIQILGALEEAHAVGIIHRDLKPENLLLTVQGGIEDFPKVLDFGLAKIHNTDPSKDSMVLTREGMVFGTPEFMSPEQARGETLDGRSDIYSLGVILYEMLTARLPFPQSKPMEYISHHIKTDPIPISERRPELNLPRELDAVVGKALEKDRDGRYQSAREFAEALKTFLPENVRDGQMGIVPDMTQRGIRTGAAHEVSLPMKTAVKDATAGKGLVVGLLAVIGTLLAVILYLLLGSGGGSSEAHVVPVTPASSSVETQ